MSKLPSIILSGFALTVMVTPSWATPLIFAQYSQAGLGGFSSSAQSFNQGSQYIITIQGSGQIFFNFQSGTPMIGYAPQLATLELTATTTLSGSCPPSDPLCVAQGSSYTESGYSGTFKITLNRPVNGESLLLQGDFGAPSGSLTGGASLTSVLGQSTGTLRATTSSSNPNQIRFTSDFLDFANSVNREATFNLSRFPSPFSLINNTGTSLFYPFPFSAIGSGLFGEELAEVPEPSTFPLLASALLALCLWQRKPRHLHR